MQDDRQETREQQWDPPQHMHAPGLTPKRTNIKRRLIIIGLTAVAVIVLGAGVYLLLGRDGGGTSSERPAASTADPQTEKTPVLSKEEAAVLKTYKSTKLNLEFAYRSDWTMRENSDKTQIILTSPPITYRNKDGVETDGVFTLKMRNGLVPEIMKPTIEKSMAVKDSEVIAYTEPAVEQRKYTNISFGGTSDNQSFFLVTGSIAFKTGDVFGSSFDTQGDVYLFAGGYGTDPNDSLGFEPVPKASFESETYTQAKAIVESLKVY